jgi:hypothetical protein
MDNAAGRSLMEAVRDLNEMVRRARSGEPSVEDYLRMVSADPITEWFTGLLREKSEELEQERERADRLASAVRTWYAARTDRAAGNASASASELQLIGILRELNIIDL